MTRIDFDYVKAVYEQFKSVNKLSNAIMMFWEKRHESEKKIDREHARQNSNH